jgi:hypothetical protein
MYKNDGSNRWIPLATLCPINYTTSNFSFVKEQSPSGNVTGVFSNGMTYSMRGAYTNPATVGSGEIRIGTINQGPQYSGNRTDNGYKAFGIRTIAYGAGVYVAGSYFGKFFISKNGYEWYMIQRFQHGNATTTSPTNSTQSINKIIYANGKFVAVGDTGSVSTSTDGLSWSNQSGLSSTTFGTASANDICWTGSKFIVIGDSGNCATSTDGVTWTYQSGLKSTTFGTVNGVVCSYGNSVCVVWGSNGAIATSPDGITWTYRSNTISAISATCNPVVNSAITFDGTRFIAVWTDSTSSFSAKIIYSNDGITWTSSTFIADSYDYGFSGIQYVSPYLYIGCSSGSVYRVSSDLVTFKKFTDCTKRQKWVYYKYFFNMGNNRSILRSTLFGF